MTEDLKNAGSKLLSRGRGSVLITGSHEESSDVINTLYKRGAPPIEYTWKRLPGSFHGSGCTLSSRIAAKLCPQLIFVKPRFERYKEISNKIIKHKMINI